MLKVLVTGGNGLLAHALQQKAPKSIDLHLCGHADFDLQDPVSMARKLSELKPQVVINTAAYNLVDKCEIERDLSWAVNATGPEILGQLCAERNCKLVHYGSDYVFDGQKRSPYVETDAPNPLNHYAAGKLHGELAVLNSAPHHLVLRTSWIFGSHPNQAKSYVHTVLRVARAGKDLKATTDQISIPTYAPDLAQWTFDLIEREAIGMVHAVNDEPVSRFEWTRIILAQAKATGVIEREPKVEAVTTAYFNPAIQRPAYSVMDNSKAAAILGRKLGSWHNGLIQMLLENPQFA